MRASPSGVWSRAKSRSNGTLPLQTWRRKMPSMIFDAWIKRASTWRSAGERRLTSAVRSVGAKRAVICLRRAVPSAAVACASALLGSGAAIAAADAKAKIRKNGLRIILGVMKPASLHLDSGHYNLECRVLTANVQLARLPLHGIRDRPLDPRLSLTSPAL